MKFRVLLSFFITLLLAMSVNRVQAGIHGTSLLVYPAAGVPAIGAQGTTLQLAWSSTDATLRRNLNPDGSLGAVEQLSAATQTALAAGGDGIFWAVPEPNGWRVQGSQPVLGIVQGNQVYPDLHSLAAIQIASAQLYAVAIAPQHGSPTLELYPTTSSSPALTLAISPDTYEQLDGIGLASDGATLWVVYAARAASGSDLDLYARRFTFAGAPLGDVWLLAGGEFDQTAPSIIFDGAAFQLVYTYNPPGLSELISLRLDTNATPIGSQLFYDAPSGRTAEFSRLACDGVTGECALGFFERKQGGAASGNVYLLTLQDGSPTSAPLRVGSATGDPALSWYAPYALASVNGQHTVLLSSDDALNATRYQANAPTPTPTTAPSGDDHEPDDTYPLSIFGQSQTRTFDPANDIDRASFAVKAGYVYRISTAANPGVDPFVLVWLERGEKIYQDDDAGGGVDALVEFTATENDLAFVEIYPSGNSRTGADAAYRLLINQLEPPTPTPQPAPPGDAYEPDDSQPVTYTNPQARTFYPAGDVDVARYYAKAGVRTVIQTESLKGATDTELQVYDAAGTLLCQDDDGNGNLASRCILSPTQDTEILVRVVSRNGIYAENTGYTLRVEAQTIPTATHQPSATPKPARPTATAVPPAKHPTATAQVSPTPEVTPPSTSLWATVYLDNDEDRLMAADVEGVTGVMVVVEINGQTWRNLTIYGLATFELPVLAKNDQVRVRIPYLHRSESLRANEQMTVEFRLPAPELPVEIP